MLLYLHRNRRFIRDGSRPRTPVHLDFDTTPELRQSLLYRVSIGGDGGVREERERERAGGGTRLGGEGEREMD